MQVGSLIKTIRISNVDLKQTLLILPPKFLKQFTVEHCATFQELGVDRLGLTMVAKGERALNRPYKLVRSKGATWVSVPRNWLRNIGARTGDALDLFETENPEYLIVQYRKT